MGPSPHQPPLPQPGGRGRNQTLLWPHTLGWGTGPPTHIPWASATDLGGTWPRAAWAHRGTHVRRQRDTCRYAHRHTWSCEQRHMCRRIPSSHTHSPRGLGGENPGHGGRILWPVSHPSELRLPRASPLTHVHVGTRIGPSEGTQRAPSVETTAGTLCARMVVGEQAGARTWMCTHSVCVCVYACTRGSLACMCTCGVQLCSPCRHVHVQRNVCSLRHLGNKQGTLGQGGGWGGRWEHPPGKACPTPPTGGHPQHLTPGRGEGSHESCQGGGAWSPTTSGAPQRSPQGLSGTLRLRIGGAWLRLSSPAPWGGQLWASPAPHALYCRQRPHSSCCGLTPEKPDVLS